MINFAIKTKDGKELLGIALSDNDLVLLSKKETILSNLSDVNVGLWNKNSDGTRKFQQPNQSQVLVINANSFEDIGNSIGVKLPSKEEIDKRAVK